eukprot:CAMPEP_0181216958 /NCGR_PEP_ID=MMETSP1096-20121128/26879_1 /TAXON_ID=156174 ORGANISM="Chrysochromulina ericina, Strain CCMP281" /NCGR_SAMPLE_ID=MMETSP1096 /ASSEMBLY_ACC=CAM_ASM_000453 /LENGTH=42 /DNA_ID= /DNA_START= /DNA_END= /DNA_ORIENTATION=
MNGHAPAAAPRAKLGDLPPITASELICIPFIPLHRDDAGAAA